MDQNTALGFFIGRKEQYDTFKTSKSWFLNVLILSVTSLIRVDLSFLQQKTGGVVQQGCFKNQSMCPPYILISEMSAAS